VETLVPPKNAAPDAPIALVESWRGFVSWELGLSNGGRRWRTSDNRKISKHKKFGRMTETQAPVRRYTTMRRKTEQEGTQKGNGRKKTGAKRTRESACVP
jgi:hypothetical protein